MWTKLRTLGLAAAVALAAGGAQAATLTVIGGTPGHLPGSFNPVNFGAPWNAGTAAYLGLDPAAVMRPGSPVTIINGKDKTAANGLALDERARVTFTYMLKEAAYTNVLLETVAGAHAVFSTAHAVIGQVSDAFMMDAGLLSFRLKTKDGETGHLDNDGKASNRHLGIAYSAIFNGGRSAIIGFDDAGAGPDRDYDDLVARVDVAPIPLPAAAWLMLAGLGGFGGLGLAGRRKPA